MFNTHEKKGRYGTAQFTTESEFDPLVVFFLCSKNAQWKGMLVGFGEVVGPNKSDQE